MKKKGLLTPYQVMRILKIKRNRYQFLIDNGILRTITIDGKIYITLSQVNGYINEMEAQRKVGELLDKAF